MAILCLIQIASANASQWQDEVTITRGNYNGKRKSQYKRLGTLNNIRFNNFLLF